MKTYFVEGLYLSKRTVANIRKGGKTLPSDIEPFARSYWAANPEEALRLAAEDLKGGEWRGTPHVGTQTEEQRMRASGQPELPMFSAKPLKKKPAKKQ